MQNVKQVGIVSPAKPTPVLKIASSKIKFAQGSKRQSEHHVHLLQAMKQQTHIDSGSQHQRLPPLMESNSKSRIQKRSESLQTTVKGFDTSPAKNMRNVVIGYANLPKQGDVIVHSVMQPQMQTDMDQYVMGFQHLQVPQNQSMQMTQMNQITIKQHPVSQQNQAIRFQPSRSSRMMQMAKSRENSAYQTRQSQVGSKQRQNDANNSYKSPDNIKILNQNSFNSQNN